MDSRKLKSTLVLNGYSIDRLLELLAENDVHMSRSTWFKKSRGDSEFTRKEIEALTHVLNINKDDMMDIFFKDEVS